LNLPWRQLLPALEKLGAQGLELEATGELAPAQLSQTGRRELRHQLRSHGLEVAAIACPLRRGLAVVENQEARVEYLKQALAMSYELGAKVVVIEPGPLPKTDDDPGAPLLTDALTALGRHGDKVGAVLALETGLDDGPALAQYLARFDTGSLGVSFNPGNLVMHGHDPVAAARALHGRVVLVHARDARAASANRAAQEVPLGRGDIDWLQMTATLAELDYRGWVTIVRGTAMMPAEAEAGIGFLRRLVPQRT
jgi:L-ribulose-5-phosphate 3-epimerase